MLSKIPFTDLKPMTTEYCNKLHQSRWEEEPSNKLYNIQNDLKHMPSPNFEYRSDETRFYRCLIGHTKITHSFLFEREHIPQCNTCQLPLSIKHIFTECISYQHQQQQYLQNKQSLSNIFLELPSENIIAFLKESDLYYKV